MLSSNIHHRAPGQEEPEDHPVCVVVLIPPPSDLPPTLQYLHDSPPSPGISPPVEAHNIRTPLTLLDLNVLFESMCSLPSAASKFGRLYQPGGIQEMFHNVSPGSGSEKQRLLEPFGPRRVAVYL